MYSGQVQDRQLDCAVVELLSQQGDFQAAFLEVDGASSFADSPDDIAVFQQRLVDLLDEIFRGALREETRTEEQIAWQSMYNAV